ncbi:MAG: acyl-CoA dehydrogenase [Planctomycetota bacterium]
MEFELNEEQTMMRDMCRQFAEKEVAPIADELDEQERFPKELVKKMAELGLMGICIPPEYGGAGMDMLSYCIAVEEISRACASTAVIMAVNNSLACQPILDYGTEEQKKEFLTPMASGQKLGCFGLTETLAGSDAANQKTRSILDGDHYVVNGSKIFISNALEADICVLFVNTNPNRGSRGVSTLIVDTKTPGFKVGKKEKKMGLHASSTCELVFEDMRVPAKNLLGKEGLGFKIAMTTLDSGRITIGAQALGIAQAAFDAALKYSKERVQFGQPISSFQAIRWMIADMATRIEAARWMTYRAAWLKDAGKPYAKEGAMTKVFCSEMARFVCDRAIQIHGGYGYVKDYKVERFYRDQRITELYEGTSEVQRLVISGLLLKG